MQPEIQKVFLDYLTFITAGHNKVLETVPGVNIHDVPKDWFTADFDHRFWTRYGFLRQSRTQSACKNDDLQLDFAAPFDM